MATIEQMSLCKRILDLAMLVTSQGRESIHVEYSAHIDCLTVYKSLQPDGWDCNDRHIYLGLGSLARNSMRKLEQVIGELEAMLVSGSDGEPA